MREKIGNILWGAVLIALGVLADATGFPCDVLGMYISAVQRGILTLFNLIFGVG